MAPRPGQSSAQPSPSSGPPAVLLKAKGGKPFGGLASLTDETSLHLTWRVSNKVAAHLEHGHRLENLSWRLWHLRDVLVDKKGDVDTLPANASSFSSSSSSSPSSPSKEQMFNALSASVAKQLEQDRKRTIDRLTAPAFRWTDANDAVRHRAVMRTRRREEKSKAEAAAANLTGSPRTMRVKQEIDEDDCGEHVRQGKDSTRLTKEKVRAIIGPTNRKRARDHTLEEMQRASSSPSSASTTSSVSTLSSSSVASSSSLAKRASDGRAVVPPTTRRTSSPPVCWRLTQEQAVRQHQMPGRRSSERSSAATAQRSVSPSRMSTTTTQKREVRSTWTLREIEDAERELHDQGVELNGAFLAMLADLKTGDLAKVNNHDNQSRHPTIVNKGTDRKAAHTVTASKDVVDDDRVKHEQNEELNPTEAKRPKPQCVNCGATSTPLWRRDANFELQCNACGLYEKLHKKSRPKALKQRRAERKQQRTMTDGDEARPTSSRAADSISPPSLAAVTTASADDWIGIHAGSTCANCGTGTTPLWRKDREGRIICNACGLYYKLHNAHRPVTMRMDAIKRRSRYDDRRRTGSIAGIPGGTASTAPTPGRHDEGGGGASGSGSGMLIGHPHQQHGLSTVPHTPSTPSSSMANAFYHDDGGAAAAAAAAAMASLPLQQTHINFNGGDDGSAAMALGAAMQHQHSVNGYPPPSSATAQQYPLLGQPHHAVAGHHHHHHLHNPHVHGGTASIDGIHIPTALWEHQVCPMGAWGENCCQNLPQPSVDLQSALIAADQHATPADQAAVTAAMDALLNNHGDWMADFASPVHVQPSHAGTPMSATNSHIPTTPIQPQQPLTTTPTASTGNIAASPVQFNPAAVASASPNVSNNAIVGPSYPLKRRKIGVSAARSSGAGGGGGGRGEDLTSEAIKGSGMNAVTPDGAASVSSNAATPTDWWTFPTHK